MEQKLVYKQFYEFKGGFNLNLNSNREFSYPDFDLYLEEYSEITPLDDTILILEYLGTARQGQTEQRFSAVGNADKSFVSGNFELNGQKFDLTIETRRNKADNLQKYYLKISPKWNL